MTVTSNEIMSWLGSLKEGTAETVVMSEGKGYYFNCDGQAHYLYQNDMTRREPNGRFKRVYVGKVQDGRVSYKGKTEEIPCKSSHVRWEKARHVKCGIRERDRKDAGFSGDTERLPESVPLQDARWKDTRSATIH